MKSDSLAGKLSGEDRKNAGKPTVKRTWPLQNVIATTKGNISEKYAYI